MIENGYKKEDLVTLLLNLSKFEYQLKNMLTSLVTQKSQIWSDDKAKCQDNMNEIAEFFSGNRNWGKNIIDPNYAEWFRNVTTMIESFDFKHATKTGRKI